MRLAAFVSPAHAVELARAAEGLRFSDVLVPEGFRGDAPSVLGAVAATTRRIGLASGLMQMPARPPVATALTAATVDSLSGGRFRLGLGVSNRDVSTGWYGVAFDDALGRTRAYVETVRSALAGRPTRHPGARGGVPATLIGVDPRPDLPILLGGVTTAGVRLAGEIADGWIGAFCTPERIGDAVDIIAQARGDRGLDGFEVLPSVPIAVADSLEAAAARVRPYYANFLGLGETPTGVYARVAASLGLGADAERVHALCRSGDRVEAAAAVPLELIRATGLVGDADDVAAGIERYRDAGVTTLGLTLLGPDLDGKVRAMEIARHAVDRENARPVTVSA